MKKIYRIVALTSLLVSTSPAHAALITYNLTGSIYGSATITGSSGSAYANATGLNALPQTVSFSAFVTVDEALPPDSFDPLFKQFKAISSRLEINGKIFNSNTNDTNRYVTVYNYSNNDQFSLSFEQNGDLLADVIGNENLRLDWTTDLPNGTFLSTELPKNAFPVSNKYFYFAFSGSGGSVSTYSVQNLKLGITSTSPVPEPASWAMMVIGFGLIGSTVRRRTIKPASDNKKILEVSNA